MTYKIEKRKDKTGQILTGCDDGCSEAWLQSGRCCDVCSTL